MDITIRSAVNEESLVNNAGNVGERNPQLTCTDCGKVVKSAGGLKNHQRSCRTKHGQTSVDNSAENLHVDDEQPNVQPVLVFETDINDADSDVYRKTNTPEQFFWGEKKGSDFTNSLNEVYERIVFWRKNLFLLPSGSSGKRFIRETTRLINSWIDATTGERNCF